MLTVKEGNEGGVGSHIGEMSGQSIVCIIRRDRERVFITFFENIDRRSPKDGSRRFIPAFHNPQRKGRPCPPVMALILE